MKEIVQYVDVLDYNFIWGVFGEESNHVPSDFVGEDAKLLKGCVIVTEDGKKGKITHCIVRSVPYPCGYECCGTEYYSLSALVELE